MMSGGQLGCPGDPSRATVGGWFTGWYLFAVDARSPLDELCAGVAYGFASAIPPWKPGPTVVRSAALGPLAGPPAPQVSILHRASVHKGRVIVASIRCSTRCSVWLNASDNTTDSFAHLQLIGRKKIGVPRDGLHTGRLLVSMHVDDGPGIAGRTRLTRA
jgi:hypothetical protein